MGGASLLDLGQVARQVLLGHGEIAVGVEGCRQREVLGEGKRGQAGGSCGVGIFRHRAGTVAGVHAVAVGVDEFHSSPYQFRTFRAAFAKASMSASVV